MRLWRNADEAPFATAPPSLLQRRVAWIVVPTILLAGLLAHGGCAGSIFYLDDWNQIVANDWVDHGLWWEAGPRAITYFTHWLTYALWGLSAPAFHVGNLLFHLGTALVAAGFARQLLEEGAGFSPRRAQRVGWWTGLLFAVHPLCSEVTNYVRTRDIELTTFFSLLAAWAALRWRRQRRPRVTWPLLALTAILAATLCKEVGFILAAGMSALVWFGTDRASDAQRHREAALALPAGPVTAVKTKLVATPKAASLVQGNWPVTLSLTLLGVCIALLAWPAWHTAIRALHHPLLGWHVLTKARVFWLGMGRVLVPVRLCSDHQIQWTVGLGDWVAWVALAAELGVILGAVTLYWQRQTAAARLVGTLLLLALWSLVHRLANPDSDLMVESRMYPALPALCVLLAWGADSLASRVRHRRPRLLAASMTVSVLVLAGATLSALRAQTWHSPETLAADVLAQYPLQNRVRKEVQDADVRAGYWTETLKRQPAMRLAAAQVRDFNGRSATRGYDLPTMINTHIATEGNCALALAKLGQARSAFEHLDWILNSLPPGATKDPVYKAALYYARGRVEAATHHKEMAVRYFFESRKLVDRPETERALRRAELDNR